MKVHIFRLILFPERSERSTLGYFRTSEGTNGFIHRDFAEERSRLSDSGSRALSWGMVLFIVIAVLITTPLFARGAAEEIENPDLVVEIDGMYCALCSDAVIKSFESHENVEAVSADYKTGIAHVILVDKSTDIDELTLFFKSSLVDLGYSLTAVTRRETHD